MSAFAMNDLLNDIRDLWLTEVTMSVPVMFLFSGFLAFILSVAFLVSIVYSPPKKRKRSVSFNSDSSDVQQSHTISNISMPKSIFEANQGDMDELISPPSSPTRDYSSARKTSYRMDEEVLKHSSSEYSSRGRIWSSRPSWHLPSAPRMNNYQNNEFLDHIMEVLKRYDVDPVRGFLPSQDPLQRLPYTRYHLWEDLADDLPKLLCTRLGQARDPLRQLPVLSIDKLTTDRELRRAHLLLCLFAHAFVWGGTEPLDFIPEGIARPLMQVSEKLGIPPVLGHPSIVLYNWRRFDVQGDFCMENLSTLNNFFDGRDENWFYLITVEIEAKGAASVVPMMLAIDAISRYREERNESVPGKLNRITLTSDDIGFEEDEDNSLFSTEALLKDISTEQELFGQLNDIRVAYYVTKQLQKIAAAINQMCTSLSAMKEGCHPFIFYHRVRPFLSGWKHNPSLPNGILYNGVSDKRFEFYGGSSSQSSLLPFLDIGLGISHESTRSRDFLLAMRDYMIKSHKEFLTYLETVACIRDYVIDTLASKGIPFIDREKNTSPRTDVLPSSSPTYKYYVDLRDAYDACVEGVRNFRSGHISLVADYILVQQAKETGPKNKLAKAAGGKGTGGTDLMKFLKPIRENANMSILNPDSSVKPPAVEEKDDSVNVVYIKDHGDFEDIDLYRGGQFSLDDSQSEKNTWRYQ